MTKGRPALDFFRVVASLLVIAVHVSPLISINATADFVMARIIARIAVPFFFMATGFFLSRKGSLRRTCSMIKKLVGLYLVSILIYLPLNFHNGYFSRPVTIIIADVLFAGTFYHLWYLPAAALGIFIAFSLRRRVGLICAMVIAAVLYLIGIGGDSYYGLIEQVPVLEAAYGAFFSIFKYTRNGLFFAPMFILLGIACDEHECKMPSHVILVCLAASLAVMMAEGMVLNLLGWQRHDSMYLTLIPCMYYLFSLVKKLDGKPSKVLRTMSTFIYIIHPWMIFMFWGFARVLHIEAVMESSSLTFYAAVCAACLAASVAWAYLIKWIRAPKPSLDGRAWVEVDLGALKLNVEEIRGNLPERCEIMAIVKANAYGHGAAVTAVALQQLGVKSFAVATSVEGIELRNYGIRGEILVLGYTCLSDVEFLSRYRLTQLVVDYSYAAKLNDADKKIKVHIAIDTGLHRLGIRWSHYRDILDIYGRENLIVTGLATHLAAADSISGENARFTNTQIERFFGVVNEIERNGYNPGKLHVQASYGIYNYPGLPCDYARAGIALYGLMSDNSETRIKPDLTPVLSLKARVAEVMDVMAGESIGYGRAYTAEAPARIATVMIGYADGVPRQISGNGGECIVHSKKAPIVGRVCMDLLMIDVTDIEHVKAGDIVTIIGKSGDMEIRCEDFAARSGTITNDILSRLGSRLPRIYL